MDNVMTSQFQRIALVLTAFLCIFVSNVYGAPPQGWTESGTYKVAGQRPVVFKIVKPTTGWDMTRQRLFVQAIAKQQAPNKDNLNWETFSITFEKSLTDPNGGYSTKWVFPSVNNPTAVDHIGTLNNYSVNNPTYTPPTLCDNKHNGMVRVDLYKGTTPVKQYVKRTVYVYRDHLQRDMVNFGSSGQCSTVVADLPVGNDHTNGVHSIFTNRNWQYTNSINRATITMEAWNCYYSARHVYNGTVGWVSGTGYTPGGALHATYTTTQWNTTAKVTNITKQLKRGDNIVYYHGTTKMHTNTIVSDGASTTWGANNKPGLPVQRYECVGVNCTRQFEVRVAYWEWATSSWKEYIDALADIEGFNITKIEVYRP